MASMAFRHPYLLFLGVGITSGILFGVALTFISPLEIPWNLLIGINLGTFLLCGYDKSVAVTSREETDPEVRRTRVPEMVLYLIALIGGSAGLLLGMKLFRHKTSAPQFQFWLVLILLVQALIIRWGVRSFDLELFRIASYGIHVPLKEKFLNGGPLF